MNFLEIFKMKIFLGVVNLFTVIILLGIILSFVQTIIRFSERRKKKKKK